MSKKLKDSNVTEKKEPRQLEDRYVVIPRKYLSVLPQELQFSLQRSLDVISGVRIAQGKDSVHYICIKETEPYFEEVVDLVIPKEEEEGEKTEDE